MTALTPAGLHADVVSLFSPAHPPVRPGTVGAELELLPAGPEGPDGRPAVLPLQAEGTPGRSLVGFLEEYAEATERIAADWDDYGSPRFRTSRDGAIGFEPGGQLEFSTEPRATPAETLGDLVGVLGGLRGAASRAGIHLLSRGMNPWHAADEVGLQLPTPRYRLMDRYFGEVDAGGRPMMRLTASLQVNLDFGSPRQAKRRWRAANLLSPVCTAAFANSPRLLPDGTLARSGRAVAWERTDPTRTGLVIDEAPEGIEAPWERYLAFAMRAGVMTRLGEDGVPHPPGGRFRFGEWCAGAASPPPRAEEWRVHLTTLFPEVRPRGWLEVRSIDTPRPEWWGVPLVLLPALLYDDEALSELLSVLEPVAPGRTELARRAARLGLEDEELGGLAEAAFGIALRAARRFPPGYFAAEMVAATAEFADRYVGARLTQADEAAPARAP
ncbi:MAG: glutamate-cysteine ligase family protein [Gemmatimonadota bacterium]